MENNQAKVIKCYILLPSTEVSTAQFIAPAAAFKQPGTKALPSPPAGFLSSPVASDHKSV